MEYNFQDIESKWQAYWRENNTNRVGEERDKPKYYILDMFPYPSGAGLHVGHPLGYVASDIYARYKKQSGFNVLHPMGFDAFGLPAEQYAIQTGQHPRITTEKNRETYKDQLSRLGFNFDWERQVTTSEPEYYKWTQWIFLQLFGSYYDTKEQKARSIADLVAHFTTNGSEGVNAHTDFTGSFTAGEWSEMNEKAQEEILQQYRLSYQASASVNWCAELGTVLANDEVQDGLSVRGGHPVVKKEMKQWFLRITAYGQRLLDSLDDLDWTDAMKEMQRNWIGRSEGAFVQFKIDGHDHSLDIFTTRPDTIFGANFMVVAPEHELIGSITPDSHKKAVDAYRTYALNKSERERQADVKTVTGEFTGAYCIHPFTGNQVPIYMAEYVLAGYGTGAIMAVPAHDSRDYAFAKHFDIEITQVVSGGDISEASYDAKEGKMMNSDFIDGMEVQEAIKAVIAKVVEQGIGERQVNYRLRDAAFSRQRYWGEPFPIYYENGVPKPMPESELPLVLPDIETFKPTNDGEPPLARAENWNYNGHPLETDTMPGYAGSSWYFFRYMNPNNNNEFVSKDIQGYWENVDLYIGGAEHATGHLLYARFWTQFLYDIGKVNVKEPFKKLINQGMIQGRSNFIYREKGSNHFISKGLTEGKEVTAIHVDVNMVSNDVLDTEAFKNSLAEYADATFDLEDGKYHCGYEVEKMSKSKLNVVNPDVIVKDYGADTFRMYEMFLGPIEIHKPWDTNGIEGVHRFLKKFWRLFMDETQMTLSEEAATEKELKILHKTIDKVTNDIERYAFNTGVSAMMVCVNELQSGGCNKKAVLEPLVRLIAPFAPHMAEELWSMMGGEGSVTSAAYPVADQQYVKEDSFEYPVAINGKVRVKINFPLDAMKDKVEEEVLANESIAKWTEGKEIRKFILVPGKMINVVV